MSTSRSAGRGGASSTSSLPPGRVPSEINQSTKKNNSKERNEHTAPKNKSFRSQKESIESNKTNQKRPASTSSICPLLSNPLRQRPWKHPVHPLPSPNAEELPPLADAGFYPTCLVCGFHKPAKGPVYQIRSPSLSTRLGWS